MEKLFAKIKKETLSKDEKTEILSALKSFVAENPAQKIQSPFYNPWMIFVRRKTFIIPALSVFMIISLTGGTILASKNSLPGEVLYPVKILNEQVQTMTAIGPKAQAEINASQAISRLQEVEQMTISKTPLSTTTKQEIQNKFGTQVQEVRRHIDELKNNGQQEDAARIQSDFESSIAKHKKAVIELSNTENQDHKINFSDWRRNNSTSQTQDNNANSDSQTQQNQGEVKGADTSNQDNSQTDRWHGFKIKQKTGGDSQDFHKSKINND